MVQTPPFCDASVDASELKSFGKGRVSQALLPDESDINGGFLGFSCGFPWFSFGFPRVS